MYSLRVDGKLIVEDINYLPVNFDYVGVFNWKFRHGGNVIKNFERNTPHKNDIPTQKIDICNQGN